MISGFLLVDKPPGWTSHDVVGKIRRLAGQKKVGHAGTLDPMATGLVIVGLGSCTRLMRYVQEQPKTYETTARFGIATDSLDADGVQTERRPMPVSVADVEAVLDRFRGDIKQVPPMVSALKKDGKRLHQLAREGKEVDRPPRDVTIHSLEVTGLVDGEHPDVSFRVTCGSGTYIRSLADDIAIALGGRAHLVALRRTHNGGHDVAAAHTVEDLENSDPFEALVLSPDAGLPELPTLELDDDAAAAVANGVRLPAGPLGWDPADRRPVKMIWDHTLRAVYRCDGSTLRPEVVVPMDR